MNSDRIATPKSETNFTLNNLNGFSYLEQLSPEQKDAVKCIDRSQIISAPAGSGKTRVLTYKIAYLIANGVKPSSILALTFTNKAANEMKSRVIELLDNNSINEIWMGTFHSIFLRILRNNSEYVSTKFKLNQHFLIYDQKAKNAVLELILEKYIKTYKEEKQKDNRKAAQDILLGISNIISRIKNEGKKVQECVSDESFDIRPYKKDQIINIYKDYRNKLQNSNAMDFDDILLYTFLMLSNNKEIAQKYQNLFEYILIDEYQDTNSIQFNIIDLIHRKNGKICAVGDDAQCIYSFRGSKIENIQKFSEKYSPTEYKLSINYRSTKEIVKVANKLILNNEHQSKRIETSKDEQNQLIENKIKIISSEDEKDEARKVIEKIIELRNKNIIENDWGSFAILYRTHKQAEPFEIQLKNMDIPYKIMGKISFLDNKIIVLIISYLRLLINEKDNISLQKIFSFSFNCISSKMKKIFDKADKSQEYYWNVINNLKPSKNDNTYILIKKFITFINSLKEQITMKEPIYFVEKIIEFIKSSFSFNEGDEDLISLFNNMAEFLTQKYHSYLRINDDDGSKENKSKDNFEGSGSFLQNNFNEDIDHNKSIFVKYSIKEFLDDIILLNTNEDIIENINNFSGNEIIPNNSNKVKLMTIHSSKGLEFNSVFIVGVEEHLYPLSYYGMKDETEEKRKKHEEEERRMFYVAITRAKQNCFITYAHKRLTGKNVMIRKKSKFIGELENKYLDFSGDIINSNENFLQFKKSQFNNNWNNNFNSFYNYKSYSHNINYNNDKNKNESFPKKSNSNSFLNKKRYNPFK